MKLIAPFGILESARTGTFTHSDLVDKGTSTDLHIGLMALPRSPLHGLNEVEEKEAQDVVDASTLPPG